MSAEQSLTVYFRPGVPPAKRHAVEDALSEALGDLFVEELGGGTMLDGSESDTSFAVSDVGPAVPILLAALRKLQVPKGSVIVQFEPTQTQWPVYDEAHPYAEPPAPARPAARGEPRPERKSKWKD